MIALPQPFAGVNSLKSIYSPALMLSTIHNFTAGIPGATTTVSDFAALPVPVLLPAVRPATANIGEHAADTVAVVGLPEADAATVDPSPMRLISASDPAGGRVPSPIPA